MTTGAALASDAIVATPLARVQICVDVFRIMFLEFFQKPRPLMIAADTYRSACGWMRGMEALTRRMLLVLAAAIVPLLPPARAKIGATPAPRTADAVEPSAEAAADPESPDAILKRDRAEESVGCASFCLLPRMHSARPASANRSPPLAFPRAGFFFRPLARRYNALIHLLQNTDAAARRLAFLIRDRHAEGELVQVEYSVPLAELPARYLDRDIDLYSGDANDLLRRLFYPDSS